MKVKYMLRSPTILPHLILSTVVVLYTLVLIFYNTVSPGNNLPFPLRDLLKPKVLATILKFNPKSVDCNVINPKSPLNVLPHNATTNTLPTTDNLTNGPMAYPICERNRCDIKIVDASGTPISSFPATNPSDPGNPVSQIPSFFFDTQNQVISYLSEPSKRAIIDRNGHLLHWIDEKPGVSGELTIKYYNPSSATLVYQGNDGNEYHYRATGIGLFINPCNEKKPN